MQVQEIFLRASEFYEDNGYFNLEKEEYEFLINQIKSLNDKVTLSELEKMQVKGIFTILLYADKEDCIKKLKLNDALQSLFKKVYSEFC